MKPVFQRTSPSRHSTAVLALLTLTAALSSTQTVWAATAYISDELTVPLRSGPSNQHRILHRGLPSGTQLEIIGVDEKAGFTNIRTVRGTDGWIRSQYLVTQPIAKARLAQAQAQLQRANAQVERLRNQNAELTQNNRSQASENQEVSSRISQLEEELAEIKRVSANAIETHQLNQQLTDTNTRLRDELDDVAEERNRLEDNAENQAILIGAGLLLLGLLVGVIIKARPQRSAWS
ncbi:MAG: TIGR04211 family SH3 domain-containing protein [Pseudomonadota bacterium]